MLKTRWYNLNENTYYESSGDVKDHPVLDENWRGKRSCIGTVKGYVLVLMKISYIKTYFTLFN